MTREPGFFKRITLFFQGKTMFLGFLRGKCEEFKESEEFEEFKETIQDQNPGISGTVPSGHGKHFVLNLPPRFLIYSNNKDY
jgi:hypothetical protein